MAQRLIVEGNDAIALAMLCKKRGLPPPLGYESEIKFQKEFVKNSGGYQKALSVLRESLDDVSLTNIGIIVDANDAGPLARWQKIRSILADKYVETSLLEADQQTTYRIVQEEKLPTIGIWIMPDNVGQGYLEHFLANLIPEQEQQLWSHAVNVVNSLQEKPYNELTHAKIGKANLHTWLAWKKEPGKPFGQAINSQYFDVNSPLVQPLLEWFSATFSLNAP